MPELASTILPLKAPLLLSSSTSAVIGVLLFD